MKQGRLKLLLPAVFIAAIFVGGGLYLAREVGDPYRTLTPLPVADYLDNAGGLRGNTYKLRGEIDDQLAWNPDGTRLLSVLVGDDLLPVLLPSALRDTSVRKGQQFHFRIEVVEGGLLKVVAFSKA